MDSYTIPIEALADGTRRAILEELRAGERSVGELTAAVPVTQPAVSQHLTTLREAGLVDVRHLGTRHLYRLRADGIAALRAYVESFWDGVLDAYADSVSPHRRQTRRRASPRRFQ